MEKKLKFGKMCATMLTFSLVSVGSLASADKEDSKIADKYLNEGYQLVWHDEFDGKTLNTKDWNVEAHEPGWVNNELQSYVDEAHLSEAITVSNGILKIQPKAIEKNKSKKGKSVNDYNFTSGRINTQGKHDFTYGRFEARIRVPSGKGYLPAFWLMASDEGFYGQWPKCGEIDITEVMGQATNKSYHTIHYGYNSGSGHKENQGTEVLTKDNFSNSYHIFSLDWEPGKLTWYVDGKEVFTTSDWYTGVDEEGQITYPAPFDQNFYVILNLAVGGNWVTNPDMKTIKDMPNQSYDIDYVRVYQKNKEVYAKQEAEAKRPTKEVSYRKADKDGNYVLNADFANDISNDSNASDNWVLHTEADAAGSKVEVKNNSIKIIPSKTGSLTHSVQLKQVGIPMYKGWEYELSFDASSEKDRKIIIDIEGPDNGWTRYFNDTTISVGPEKKSFKFNFTMKNKTDSNGSLEFNLGNLGSTSPVTISNVKLIHVSGSENVNSKEKSIRPDGNYVYNGTFDQGEKRLGNWNISDENAVSVTNENLVRRLKVVVPNGSKKTVKISQDELSPLAKGNYLVSFDAESAKNTNEALTINVAGQKYKANLGEAKNYTYKLQIDSNKTRKDSYISFEFDKPGTYYIDNISIIEDVLIKNASFNSGLVGYVTGAYSPATATFGVDSIQADNDNALDCNIKDTGNADWNVQIKQSGVNLIKGHTYKLSFDAKCTVDRKISVVMQRDGTSDNNWDVYSGDNNVSVSKKWKTYEKTFTMNSNSDTNALLSISLGAVAGKQISTEHHVYLDNFSLEEIK